MDRRCTGPSWTWPNFTQGFLRLTQLSQSTRTPNRTLIKVEQDPLTCERCANRAALTANLRININSRRGFSTPTHHERNTKVIPSETMTGLTPPRNRRARTVHSGGVRSYADHSPSCQPFHQRLEVITLQVEARRLWRTHNKIRRGCRCIDFGTRLQYHTSETKGAIANTRRRQSFSVGSYISCRTEVPPRFKLDY